MTWPSEQPTGIDPGYSRSSLRPAGRPECGGYESGLARKVRGVQQYTTDDEDLRLLDLPGLAPLDTGMAAGEQGWLAMIEEHNKRCSRALHRLRRLIEDRRRLHDFDAWRGQDGMLLLAERGRVREATWSTLVELRHALDEREDVLERIEQELRTQYHKAGEEHDRMVTSAERRLAGQRRRLERANPSTAASHFGDLIAQDKSVREAAERKLEKRIAFENAATARRNLAGDLHAVTVRQREVFGAMIG